MTDSMLGIRKIYHFSLVMFAEASEKMMRKWRKRTAEKRK